MRDVSDAFKARLASGFCTLTRLWEITVTCKKTYRFTDNTRDIYYLDQNWYCDPGIEISAIRKSTANGYDDAQVKFPVVTPVNGQPIETLIGIDEETVRYNELNGATFRILGVFFDDLSLGHMELFSGRLGDATIEAREVNVTAYGSTRVDETLTIGEVYSERCRNVIYDSRCKVNPARFRVKFRVIGVRADGSFLVSITIPPPDEADPEENTDVTSSVSESLLTGAGNYTVPADCTELSVEVSGGGGAAFALETDDSVPGAALDGKDTTFGTLMGTGGKGAYRYFALSTTAIYAADGIGTGGTTNDSKGAKGGKVMQYVPLASNGGPYLPGMEGDVFDTTIAGGDGGHCAKVYTVGVGKDLVPGQVIAYSVGNKGVGGISGQITENGEDGYIKLSAATTTITTIERATEDFDYDFGSIQWTKGDNICRISDIRDVTGKIVTPMVTTLRPVQVGDEGFYRPGCSNYRSSCINKFNNLHNFRAEPDVPSITAQTQTVTNVAPPVPDDTGNFTSPPYLFPTAG